MQFWLSSIASIIFLPTSFSSTDVTNTVLDISHELGDLLAWGGEGEEPLQIVKSPRFSIPRNSGNGKSIAETETRILRRRKRRKERENNIRYRIIGGADVKNEEEYPFFVELAVGCGASLVSENTLLTAAHCLSEQAFVDPNVWIGSYTSEDGIKRRINGVAIHPSYGRLHNIDDFRFDFALLTLNEPIINDEDINKFTPVELNRNSKNPSEPDSLTVIGLGQLTYNGNTASRLQELNVPYVPHQKCEQIYAQPEANIEIDEQSMLCAGGNQNEDSCMGDSGGPILDATGVQVGVVSFGAACGDEGWPGVYSRVSGAVDWIDDFVCSNSVSIDSMPSTCERRFRVQLDIDENDHPEEISWNINQRDDGRSVLTVPEDNYLNQGTYSRGVNLAPGRYSFQIEDSQGDGIGGSNYKISVDGQQATTIERDGAFGYHDFINFEITESGELLNSIMPYLGDKNQIRIDIMYDNYPEETAWALINRDTRSRIFVSKRGSITKAGLVSVPLEIPDGNYWLLVVDAADDGICCSYGRGSIEVNRVVNGADTMMASHRGTYEKIADMEFSLP